MKAMAALFITWFHFKWSVPKEFAPFFIGGAIGNSLFFFCSGYLLKFKEEQYLGQWMVNKYFRVMPTVWFTYLVVIVLDLARGRGLHHEDVLRWFIPNGYWFIVSILLYFLICWVTKRWLTGENARRNVLWMMTVVGVVQIVWYDLFCEHSYVNIDEGYLKAWYFFIFFLWGYYERGSKMVVKNTRSLVPFMVLASLGLFYGYKKWQTIHVELAEWQVLLVPLLLAFVILSFRYLANVLLSITTPIIIKNVIFFLSSITLEIYVVQMYFINWMMPLMPFPVNIVVSLVVILLAAYTVHIMAGLFTSKLKFL